MPKVYVERQNPLICSMFVGQGWETVYSLEDADLVCFEGGADVTPALYGELNTDSWNSESVDFNSIVLWNNARRLGIPMVGICRGGQFLNVMNGGKMIQDYDGHAIADTHEITVIDSWFSLIPAKWQVTSTHHQVMIPHGDSDLIAYGKNKKEAEIIQHGDSSLSFQPHPEYVEKGHECQELFFYLIDQFYDLRA